MDKIRNFLVVVLAIVVNLFTLSSGWSQPQPEVKAPVITHAFAVDKGYYGYVWKIYIEAEDPDADMLRIAVAVDQVGGGRYPTHWTYLKKENQQRVKGYLQWNTFSSKAEYLPEWNYITVRVSVFDKAGNESNEVVLPFTFVSGAPSQYKLPPPFDQGDVPRLGYIMTELYNPYRGYSGGYLIRD